MVCSCKPRPTCSTVAASAARRATAHAPLLASSATVAAQAPAAVGGEGSRVPPCASSSTACWDAACGQGTGRAAAVGAHSLLAYSCSRGSAYGQLRAGRGGAGGRMLRVRTLQRGQPEAGGNGPTRKLSLQLQ